MSTSQKFTYKGKEYLIKKGKEYTATYKKYQREQVKAANGEMKMTAEPDYIYDMTTDRFVVKKRYINSRNGGLKAEFAKKGYTLNEFGNIVSRVKEEPELEHSILIEFLATWIEKGDKDIKTTFRRTFLNDKKVVKFNNKNKAQKVQALIDEERRRIRAYLEDSNIDVISIEVQLVNINQLRQVNHEEIRRIKMKGASAVNLSSPAIGVNHDNVNTDDCVPRAITNHVNNPKEENPRKRLKQITMNDILRLLNTGERHGNTDFTSTQFEGFDSDQVMNAFTALRIPCYALDHRRECFLNNLEDIKDNRNKDMKSFVYMAWNQHMYVIEDNEFKELVFKSESKGSKMKFGSKQSKKESKKEKKSLPIAECKYKSAKKLRKLLEDTKQPTRFICTFDEVNIVHKLFYDEIKIGNIHDDKIKDSRNLKLDESTIMRFGYKDHVVEYNPDYHDIKIIVKRLNENIIIENEKLTKKYQKQVKKNPELQPPTLFKLYKTENATFHSLARQYFEMNFGIQLSQLGEQGDQVMNSPPNSAFNEFWDYPENLKDYHGYDIRKQYSSILRSVSMGWSVYNPMNEIRSFSGKLQEGFYYVESENYFPLKGNGWYNGEALIEYVADGIISNENIKYEFLPSTILNGEYFQNFVNEIYEKFGPYAKQAINGFIGMLRVNQSTRKTNYFFNDVDTLFMHMSDSQDSKFKIVQNKIKTEPEGKFKEVYNENGSVVLHYEPNTCEIHENDILAYHVINEKKWPLTYNSTPIHRKIYDIATLQIYRMAKAVGINHLFGIRTDALYFNGGNRLEPNEEKFPIGGFRFEPIKPKNLCNFKRGTPRDYSFTLSSDEWNNNFNMFDDTKGAMITGCAGTGKSYKAKELTKYLSDNNINYRVCAPTKAAAMIHEGGETIHKLFGFDPVAPMLNISKLHELTGDGVKVIIVDEISMINACIWGLLMKIKKFSGFTFFGFGDAAQCAPVKEEKQFKHYFSSALCAELFDNRRMELIENFRCKNDPEFADLNVEFVNAREGRKINVSKFGKKICDRAIAYTNAQCKKHNDIIMNKYKRDDSMKVKDTWVYVGLPVKATLNTSRWSNNEQFEVVKFDTEIITLRSNMQKDKDGKHITLNVIIEDFEKYFQCAYCTTVHCAQGQTYDFEFTIYEYNVMSSNILYTALSRTTKKSNINLVFKEVNKSYVYGCINLKNNKYYIGSTIDYNGRIKQHQESQENDKFHTALRDEGLENFIFVNLYEGYLNEKSLLVKEQEFISKYNSIEQGYNSKLTTKSD